MVTSSSALLQWEEEIQKWTTFSCQVIGSKSHGTYSTPERIAALGGQADIFVCPYSMFSPHKRDAIDYGGKKVSNVPKYIQEKALWECMTRSTVLVFDEVTRLRGTSSLRGMMAYRVAKRVLRVWGLSATLVTNTGYDVYGVYKIIYAELFGTKKSFSERYVVEKVLDKDSPWIKKIIGYRNVGELKEKLYPFYLSRRKAHVAPDLPSVISTDTRLSLTPEQQRWYNAVLDGTLLKEILKKKGVDECDANFSEIQVLGLCRQIANNPVLVGGPDTSAKERQLFDMLAHEFLDTKIILFTFYEKWVRVIDAKLQKRGIGTAVVSGPMDADKREKAKRRFRESKSCQVMLMTEAGSEAINLQFCDTILFLDLPLMPGTYYQTIGRVHRIGSQSDHVFLNHLLCLGTVDEKIRRDLAAKMKVADAIADMNVGDLMSKKINATDLFEEEFGMPFDRYIQKLRGR